MAALPGPAGTASIGMPSGAAGPGALRRVAGTLAGGGPWSTPTVLRTARLAVALLIAATGLLAAGTANARAAAVADVTTRLQPLSADAGAVQRGLVAAHTAVTSEFAAGLDSSGPTGTDADELDAVAAATLRAAGRTDDPVSREALTRLGTGLPRYAALVAAARAEPAAETPLRAATTLLRTQLLPAADTLQREQARSLASAQSRIESTPVPLLVIVGLIIALLIVFQFWLAHRFRRALNLGMVITTVALVSGVLGWTVAEFAADDYVAASRANSAALDQALLPAQLDALRARTAEGSALLDPAGTPPGAFDDAMRELDAGGRTGGALGTAEDRVSTPAAAARLREARAAAADYRAAHERVRLAAAAGRHDEAVRLAFADPTGSTAAFQRLDRGLAAAADAQRGALAGATDQGWTWWATLGPATALLALLAGGAAALGLTARLKEYP